MNRIKIISSNFGPGIEVTNSIERTRDFMLGLYDNTELFKMFSIIPVSNLQIISSQGTIDPGCYYSQDGKNGYKYAIRVPKDSNGVYGMAVLNNKVYTENDGWKIDSLYLIYDPKNNHIRFSMNRSDIDDTKEILGHASTHYSKNYDNLKPEEMRSQIFGQSMIDGKEYFDEEKGRKELNDGIEELFGEFRKCNGLEELIDIEKLYILVHEIIKQKER